MTKNTLSDEIRRLEELREEGFLGEKQFLREVHDVMKRREHERVDELAPAPEPTVLAAHSVPMDFSPTNTIQLETPTLRLEDPAPDDEPDHAAGTPSNAASGARDVSPEIITVDPGRVIIRGKAPWDDHQGQAISLQSPREEKLGPEAVFNKEKNAADIVKRQKLARMAEKSNRILRRKKNPDAALIMSLCWAGLGNMYIGQIGSGLLFMLLGGGAWIAVAFGFYDLLWVALPLGLLSGAVARKAADQKNRSLDALSDVQLRLQPKVSRLNVEKSLRKAPPPSDPKGR